MSGPTRSRRRLGALAVVVCLAGVGAWLSRATWLRAAGAALVAEDALVEPVDVVFLAYAAERGGALEAARLFAEGRAVRVASARWPAPPVDEEIRALGVPLLAPTELAARVLERGGVPPERVDLLPVEVGGTGDEVEVVASFVRERRAASVCYVTARSHTARSRWLLGRALPPGVTLAVRSPRHDRFTPAAWWKDRAQAREVALEYLRWANALFLGDAWAAGRAPAR